MFSLQSLPIIGSDDAVASEKVPGSRFLHDRPTSGGREILANRPEELVRQFEIR
jgi:hypothetical protein